MKPEKSTLLISIFTLLFPLLAFSASKNIELKTLLESSLSNTPQVQEAIANLQASKSNVKKAEAGHYPVVSLMGTQPLAQEHKYESNSLENSLHLGVKANMNIYAWGGIEAGIDREKEKENYYNGHVLLTNETVSEEIGKLYLSVLRNRETLNVIDENRQQHQKILNQLETIVKHDSGRVSELTQVKARMLKVEMSYAETERNLLLAIKKLSILTGQDLQVEQLVDPFRNTDATTILHAFQDDQPENNLTYQVQLADKKSLQADLAVVNAERKPAVNLEANATKDNREIFIRVSWNIFDQATYYSRSQKEYALSAANARLQKSLQDIKEMSESAAINMVQSERQNKIAIDYIAEQKRVVSNYEKQFIIGRRSLIDLLDAYNELASIQTSSVISKNDFRDATLNYLGVQTKITAWMNQTTFQ